MTEPHEPPPPGDGAEIWVTWRTQAAFTESLAALPVPSIIQAITAMSTPMLRDLLAYGIATFEASALRAWHGIITRTLAGQGDGSPLADDEDDRRVGAAVVLACREGNAERVERWRRSTEP